MSSAKVYAGDVSEKVTITMPSQLVKRLKKTVKKGKMSEFISGAAEERMKKLESEVREQAWAEAYKVSAERDLKIAEDFIDAENDVGGDYGPT